MESVGTGLTGAIMGQSFGAIPGYQAATQQKREAKQGQQILDSENFGKLEQAGQDYGIQVADYQKQYEDLLGSYKGPELETKLKDLAKPIDVKPELYDFKRLEKSTFRKLTGQAGDVLLNRSTDFMETVRQNAKTGKDFFHLNRALRSFADVQSGTGETQTNPSFNSLKGKNVGEYVEPFMDIRDKWARHYPLGGEIGSKVAIDIDTYIGQVLEAKVDKDLKQEVSSRLGAERMSELEADITKLKAIRSKVFGSLQSRLGKDGLKIGFIKDYLTRGIDKKAVKADPQAFLDSLENDVEIGPTKDKVTGEIIETADEVRQRILNDILNDVDPSTLVLLWKK